jgi:flagellin
MASLYAQRSLATAQADLASSVEKLSSGKRINRAQDDIAGLGISEGVMGVKNITDQSIRSTQNAISVVQAAEGARQVAGKILQRVLTLTTQKENTILNNSQISSIDGEIASLIGEIGKIRDRTRFQGGPNSIFGVDFSLTAGAGVAARTISIRDLSADDLGVSGLGGSKTVNSSVLASLFSRQIDASGITIPATQSFNSVVPNSVVGTTAAVSSSFVAATLNGGQSAAASVQSAKTASNVQSTVAALPVTSVGLTSRGDVRFYVDRSLAGTVGGNGASLLYTASPGSSVQGLVSGGVYQIGGATLPANTGDYNFQLKSGGDVIERLGTIVGSNFSFQRVQTSFQFNPIDTSGNIILGTSINLNDGAAVVFTADSSTLVRNIANLDLGKTYYIQNVLDVSGNSLGVRLKDVSGNVINLDASLADGSFSLSGVSPIKVDFTSQNIRASTLNLTGSAFLVNDQVQYTTDVQDPDALQTGAYFVTSVTTVNGNNSIQLSDTLGGVVKTFEATTGGGTSSVTLISRTVGAEVAVPGTITITSNTYQNGDAVKYTSSGSAIGNLPTTGTYYVRDVSGNSFKLAATSGGTAIDLTSSGSGTINFTKGTIFSQPTSAFIEGDQVIYDGLASSGSAVTGLTLGATYTVHLVNSGNSFQLVDSSNSVVMNGSGTQLFRKTSQPTVASSDTITVSNNTYQNGDAIAYTSSSAIGGLSTTSTYYVRDVSGNSFKLASTVGGAAINLTSTGSGTQTFSKGNVFGQPSSAFIEGAQVIYDGKQDASGNNVTGLTVGNTYTVHLVNSGNSFQLIDSTNKVLNTSDVGTGAQLFSNASQPSIAQTDTITTSNNTYQNGDGVKYTSANAIGGLSTTSTYYVRDVSGNSFKLASTAGGSAINLTSAGSGAQTFAKGTTFNQPSTVFTEGAQVIYSGKQDASGNNITGLTVGNTYTVHLVNSSNSFQLVDSNNKVVNTSDVGAGVQIFSAPSSNLYMQGHGFSVGDQVTYNGSTSGVGGDISTATGTLTRGVYTVKAATTDTFQLANTASPTVALSFTGAGSGVQQFSGGSAMTSGSIATAIQNNARYTAELGAQINILAYAVDNMQTLSNNLANAYSRIVDVDYAAETSALTRNQIMQEAATSMLAQANQMPNVILTLLT